MERRIVVGVDPAREHDAAVEFAVGQARRRGSPLHLVVVLHPGHAGPDQLVELKLLGDELAQVDRVLLERCVTQVERWAPDVDVSTEVRHGPVAPALAATVEHGGLLVLGHHRMTRARHLPTFSVTSRVAAMTSCPVYAVPDDWHELRDHGGPVVAAVEDPDSGRGVAGWAFSEAALAGAGVRVVRAWSYADLDPDEELLPEATTEALADLVAEHRDVPCHVDVVHGQAAYTLVEASRRARLMVIGRHHPRVAWGAHLGPVTRAVLAHARCPVAVVDTGPARPHGVTPPIRAR